MKGPTPVCCGKDAVWTVIGIKLQYWFCKECRQEVTPQVSTPKGFQVSVDLASNGSVATAGVMMYKNDCLIQYMPDGTWFITSALKDGIHTIRKDCLYATVNGKICYDMRVQPQNPPVSSGLPTGVVMAPTGVVGAYAPKVCNNHVWNTPGQGPSGLSCGHCGEDFDVFKKSAKITHTWAPSADICMICGVDGASFIATPVKCSKRWLGASPTLAAPQTAPITCPVVNGHKLTADYAKCQN